MEDSFSSDLGKSLNYPPSNQHIAVRAQSV